jgi:hypothetical protein
MKPKLNKSGEYFLLTILAFALIGFGLYLINLGGILYVVGGGFLLIVGYIIGHILYTDNWGNWH